MLAPEFYWKGKALGYKGCYCNNVTLTFGWPVLGICLCYTHLLLIWIFFLVV